MPPRDSQQTVLQRAFALHRQGALGAAERLYRQVLRDHPDQPDALHHLGLIACRAGHRQQGLALLQRSLELRPDHRAWQHNLNLALANHAASPGEGGPVSARGEAEPLGQEARDGADRTPSPAEARLRHALATDPSNMQARLDLATLLMQTQRAGAAERVLREGQHLHPEQPLLHARRAQALVLLGRLDAAEQAAREALALEPHHMEGLSQLANIAMAREAWHAAERWLVAALARRPTPGERAMLYSSLAAVRFHLRDTALALRTVERSLALNPHAAQAASLRLYLGNYLDEPGPEQLADWHRDYGRRFAPSTPHAPHRTRPDPTRGLRIGLCATDLRNHVLLRFVEGWLQHRDRTRNHLIFYSDVTKLDGEALRVRGLMDAWLDVRGWSDQHLAARIRADRIDVLVDLIGHCSPNRLGTFALKPAPVQVTTLGYVNGTGLPQMDWRLGDPHTDPPEHDGRHVEGTWRMPRSYSGYHERSTLPPVAPPPVVQRGSVTFGSFNNPAKFSDRLLGCWADLLQRLPSARLVLNYRELREPLYQAPWRRRFAQRGVDPGRLLFRGDYPTREAYLESYAEVDIALDTFPHNGMTISHETVLMGLPLVTLEGIDFVSRSGLSICTNLGHPEWVARDEADYVDKALRLAADVPALCRLRDALRAEALTSPLFDAPRFARELDAGFQAMWARWCAKHQDTSAESDTSEAQTD